MRTYKNLKFTAIRAFQKVKNNEFLQYSFLSSGAGSLTKDTFSEFSHLTVMYSKITVKQHSQCMRRVWGSMLLNGVDGGGCDEKSDFWTNNAIDRLRWRKKDVPVGEHLVIDQVTVGCKRGDDLWEMMVDNVARKCRKTNSTEGFRNSFPEKKLMKVRMPHAGRKSMDRPRSQTITKPLHMMRKARETADVRDWEEADG